MDKKNLLEKYYKAIDALIEVEEAGGGSEYISSTLAKFRSRVNELESQI